MKIQERTGAGTGRAAAPARQPSGDRLPTVPRERRPAMAALAVLLILLGALGATTLVLRAGDRLEVVQLKKDVPKGASISDGDIQPILVNGDSGADFVPWTSRENLKELGAKSTLYAKTVLVGQMFGEKASMDAGEVAVGLALKQGHYPAGLADGDEVAAYRVGDAPAESGDGEAFSGSTSAESPLVERAVVRNVVKTTGDDEGDVTGSAYFPVTLTVDSADAAPLARAAASGEVALVLLPADDR
ncbi:MULTISPECIES: hypothetical protein [unclassified Streptomyces]|uniref:hypothetical protein n=1 Tax=unclassified Streptomyces TaxID=2593676 RepID=UPI001903DF2A|nr:hypothetical protein [Streptomyces sp. HSG2]